MSKRGSAKGPQTPATTALEKRGITFTTHTYDHDATAVADGLGYGAEAAAALGVDAARVFKTLLVDVAGSLGVVIVPVLARVDLKAAAAALGGKRATMADPAAAERSTGYVVGGISPIGQRKALPTVLDSSALAFNTIFVSGGRRGFDIELSPADLLTITRGHSAPVATQH